MRLPEAVTRQLRRIVGPDPALIQQLLQLRGDLAIARAKQVEFRDKANQRQVEIDRLQARLAKLQVRLAEAIDVEPGPAEGCTKVRLRDRDEAWEFAQRVAADSGQDIARFKVYACPLCPRQPVGVGRFLHITNGQNAQQRSEARIRNAARRDRGGTALGDRIDSSIIDRLRREA